MVTIRRQLVSGSVLTSGSGNPATSITVHQTGNVSAGANAAAHADLQSRGNVRSASWHWTVDDTEAVQSFTHATRCWHAGTSAGNNTSVGIEVCVNCDGDYSRALQNAAELVAYVMRQTGVPVDRVVQHKHWSGKDCPEQIRAGKAGVGWTAFLEMVRSASTVTPPTEHEEDIMASLADVERAVDARMKRPWFKVAGTTLAWEDLGSARRAGSRQRYEALGSPTICTLDLDDSFWRLPVVGDPLYREAYKHETTPDIWYLDAVDGSLCRVWADPQRYAAAGKPRPVPLEDSHSVWALPTYGPLPTSGKP